MTAASIGFVVSTLGRVEALETLLASLAPQVKTGDHIVLVAQGRQDEVHALVETWRTKALPITFTTSDRGASLGRNVGVEALDGQVELLHFPNDTTTFPQGSVDAIRAMPASAALGGLEIWVNGAPKLKTPAPGTALTAINAWSIIEMGLVIRREVFVELGGFDTSIGTGAQTPWQAGESTDLVLRALRRFGPQCVHWFRDDAALGGIAEGAGLTPKERSHKLRAYNRGTGVVVRRGDFPLWWQAAFLFGGIAWGVRHPQDRLVDGWWVFVGRLEGMRGKVFGGGDVRAVTR